MRPRRAASARHLFWGGPNSCASWTACRAMETWSPTLPRRFRAAGLPSARSGRSGRKARRPVRPRRRVVRPAGRLAQPDRRAGRPVGQAESNWRRIDCLAGRTVCPSRRTAHPARPTARPAGRIGPGRGRIVRILAGGVDSYSKASRSPTRSFSRSGRWTGFTRWPSHPASFDLARSTSCPQPVTAMTAMSRPHGCSRRRRVAS